jgi:hypothetical protein
MDAGMDDTWVPEPRAGLDRPPPAEQSYVWPWNRGKMSSPEAPTDTPAPTNDLKAELNPFASLIPAALMFKKQQPKANQALPANSTPVAPAPTPPPPVVPKARFGPVTMSMTPTQWAAQAPKVPGADFTQGIKDRRVSQMLRVTCTECGQVIFAIAIPNHRCAKPKMTPAEKVAFNPKFDDFYQPKFTAVTTDEDESPEYFVDTYVQAAGAIWSGVTRQ